MYSTLGTADIRDYIPNLPALGANGSYGGPAIASIVAQGIQAAHDSGKPRVWFPYDPLGWWSNVPLFHDRNALWEGEFGTWLHFTPDTDTGIFLGIARNPMGRILTPGHIVSSSGLLDSSVIGANGISFQGDSHFAQQFGTITGAGQRWAQPCLTIDLAADLTASQGSLDQGECLLGWGASTPSPVAIWDMGSSYLVELMCNDGLHGFTIPRSPTTKRLSIQIQVDQALVIAFTEKKQINVRPTTAWSPNPLRCLVANNGAPFCVGACSDSDPTIVTNYYGAASHAVLLGLRVGVQPLYQNNGVGTPQLYLPNAYQWAAVDNAMPEGIQDHDLYFAFAAGTWFYLPMTDSPAAVCGNRLIRVLSQDPVTHANNHGYGLLFTNGGLYNGPTCGMANTWIRNLNVVSHHTYGCAIAMGSVVNALLDYVTAQGGGYGLGNWGIDGGYVTRFKGYCKFGGNQSSLRLSGGVFHAQDLELNGAGGGYPVAEFSRCAGHAQYIWVNGNGSPDHVVRGSGCLVLDDMIADIETPGYPAKSVIDFTAVGGNPQNNRLVVSNLITGSLGSSAVIVDLHDDSASSPNPGELMTGPMTVLGAGYPGRIRVNPSAKGTTAWRVPWDAAIQNSVGVASSVVMFDPTGILPVVVPLPTGTPTLKVGP